MATRRAPAKDESSAMRPTGSPVPLESVLCTEELNRGAARPPDYRTENRALATLAQALADSPRSILQTLADTMLQVLKAGSAGMSLLTKDEKKLEWAAIAGAWKPHLGRGTPRHSGPCGDVLDCNAPLLFRHWERRYPCLLEATPLAEEALLVPFRVAGKAVGVIWAISHDVQRKFDAEDLRQLESLSRFASAACQAVASLDMLDQRRAALNLMEDAVESRQATERLNTELRESEEFNRSIRQSLQLLAEGAPLDDVLGFLIGAVEHDSIQGTVASIVPLNEAGTHFQRGIGASLPDAFNAMIEGMPVSSPAGLCAAAVRRREAVAVYDFNGDPAWHAFGKLAAPHGLRSGWSAPIISAGGQVLGAFANYYRNAGDPAPQNQKLVDMVVRTAAITIERKRAEQATQEAARRFRFMAESMPQKIFTAKPNGEVDYFNQQWMDYTGLAFEQIKDWGWKQFIHPDDLAENVRIWRRSIDRGEPFHFEHRFRRADGAYRWHLSRAVAMRDDNGNITMWIGSNTDIQAVREQEDRLRKTEKLAAAGRLASSMAHEINNPLSSVTNALYLLEGNASLDEPGRFFVATAATELARVSRIVKQSLSYYRVGTVPRDLDLGAILSESLQIFSEKLKRTGIELKQHVIRQAPLVGFPDELRQVIDNLLLNAMEAMPSGGRLSISVHESFNWTHHQRRGVRLTIADTGCGIPKEYRLQIFEPFFTTKAEKGTGLGLWILQGIIAKHDGIMTLRSSDTESKSGTIISIFFPSSTIASRKAKFDHETESAA